MKDQRGLPALNSSWNQLNQNTSPAPLTFGAIGDAYGFCFEFAKPNFVNSYNDLHYHQHPEFTVRPGAYSDDTQMHIAVAELMLSNDEWTKLNVATKFVNTFKRDPRAGYAKGFHAFLTNVRSGSELLHTIKPTSDRNGACMRASAIGLLPDISTVKHHAILQARVTHDTVGGIDSAVAAALMSHYFVYQLGDKSDLPVFLTQHLPAHPWTANWVGKVRVHGISTVQAALTVIVASTSLTEILQRSVAFTGDVDSVATIACACASSSRQFQRDIPAQLWDGFESSDWGLDYLHDLDQRLVNKFVAQEN